MADTLEQHLLEDFLEGTRRLKREIGYNPTYFTPPGWTHSNE